MGDFMVFFVFVVGVLMCLVHFAFALGVLVDAGKLDKSSQLYFVTECVWFFATLFGGVFVATAFWVMHHSRLCPAVPTTEPEPLPL